MPLQEEQKAKDEKDALIAAAKKRGAEKAKLTKSLIIMDVKPWDDTTGALLSAALAPLTLEQVFGNTLPEAIPIELERDWQ